MEWDRATLSWERKSPETGDPVETTTNTPETMRQELFNIETFGHYTGQGYKENSFCATSKNIFKS